MILISHKSRQKIKDNGIEFSGFYSWLNQNKIKINDMYYDSIYHHVSLTKIEKDFFSIFKDPDRTIDKLITIYKKYQKNLRMTK
jgi:hypothetical protein